MRIEHLYLKNYRCFETLSVDIHPQMTVLVAPNGQGKTSVLDAIKVALWPFVAGFDLGSTTNDVTSIQIDDVRREQVRSHEMDWRLTTEDAAEYGVRCAYCEGPIFHEGHIEHFRRKNSKHYPELTFDWNNLFLACGSNMHCGHYKDRPSAPAYDPDQLIKPDEHDPEELLYFHSSGSVRVRAKLSAENSQRANATIHVFDLDNPALEGKRARAVAAYRKMKSEDFEELASWDEVDRREYLESEIQATCWHPYATTIKHFLQHL